MPIQFITPSIISSVANTQVTGTITASQLATSLNLATNNVQVASIQSATGTPGITFAANGQIATVNTVTANVTTLNAPSGVLATQNGMTGIPRAWAQWNGRSGASPVIRGSFNISSITRNAVGDYTVTFTTAMPDVNYSVTGTGQYTDASTSGRGYFLSLYSSTSNPFTTGSVRVVGVQVDSGLGAYGDSTYITIIVCGN